MSDQSSSLGASADDAGSLASIAIFQYDHVAFKLEDPKIFPLPLAFSMESSSDLWKASIMKRNDQEAQNLPQTSIRLVRSSTGGYSLLCPHGLFNLEIFVDKVQLTDELVASGFPLRHGQLVKLFCFRTQNPTSRTHCWRKRVGPLVFQYTCQTPSDSPPVRSQELAGQRKLDQLPMEILRMIFANLPVDDALHSIPATCRRFFEALQEGLPFSRWEIGNGGPTMREAAFSQGWMGNRVSNLVLRKVPMVTDDDRARIFTFVATSLEPNKLSLRFLEANLEFKIYDCRPGNEHRYQYMSCMAVTQYLSDFQALKKVKLHGFPTHLTTLVGRGAPLRNVEHVWFSCKGKDRLELNDPEGRLRPQLPKLRRITFKFSLEGNLLTTTPPDIRPCGSSSQQPSVLKPCWPVPNDALPHPSTSQEGLLLDFTSSTGLPLVVDLQGRQVLMKGLSEQVELSAARRAAARVEPTPPQAPEELVTKPPIPYRPGFISLENSEKFFSNFAPALAVKIERIFILESTGDSWKNCQRMLAKLHRLDALSLTIDAHLTEDEMWDLIRTIPGSVKFLRIMTPMSFTDDWCLAVATGCMNLEMFCCYGPEVTAGGVRPLVIACERLTKLFVLHDEVGVRVAREDILPDELKRFVRVYESELSCIFD